MSSRFSSVRGIKDDLSASVVVFLVALPLCLGIGLASTGRPDLVFAGVIAGIVGGLVVGFFSGSAIGVSGPAAGLVVIVLSAMETLGSFEALLLATFLAGVLQFIGGYLKAGIIGYYFPSSVIKGMLAAIGLTLILKEIPHALGYDKNYMGDEALKQADGHNTFNEIFYALEALSPAAMIISVVSIGLLILFERPVLKKISVFKFLPGALFVVVTGILLNYLFTQIKPEWVLAGEHVVQLPVANNASEFISFFRLPDFSSFAKPQIYLIAATIALVASLGTLLCLGATHKLDPLKRSTPTNRELKAQGIGNMISGLIGGSAHYAGNRAQFREHRRGSKKQGFDDEPRRHIITGSVLHTEISQSDTARQPGSDPADGRLQALKIQPVPEHVSLRTRTVHSLYGYNRRHPAY